LETSAALLETDRDQDTVELLWCNGKFEKSFELSYFTSSQVFDFKIFKFEAIINQATPSRTTLYELRGESKGLIPGRISSLLDIVREFKQQNSKASSQLFFLALASSSKEQISEVMLQVNLKVVSKESETSRILLEIRD
jgi:hypothetical protein